MQRICARAPVRVDPAGGGTDAPPFSVEHGGMVVNFGIQRYAYAFVDRLAPRNGVTIYSEDLNQGISAQSVPELPTGELGLLRGFVKRLAPETESLVLVTESDVPPGAGLGGSGALGVAVVAALDRAFGGARTAEQIARLANEIERKDLGYPGGDQDSFGSALGGINKLEYVKGGGTVPHRVSVSDTTRLRLERNSLLIYTSEAHVSGNIHHDIRESYALENSPTVAAMIKLREAAIRMASALECGDIGAYVDSMNESCENLYRLHSSCDSDAHRKLNEALGDCILARKTCGAGGGGFMLVHTRPGRRRECRARAENMGASVWPVSIDFDGIRTWSEEPSTQAEIGRYRTLSGCG